MRNSFSMRMIKEAKPVMGFLILALLSILLLSLTKALRPQITSDIINLYLEGFTEGSINKEVALVGIEKASIYFFLITLIEFIMSFIRSFALSVAGMKVLYNIRQRLFNHVQNLPLSYFDKTPVGAIVTRLTNDPAAIGDLFNIVLVGFVQSIVYIVVILVFMFAEDITLSLVSIALIPFIAFSTVLFRKVARRVFGAIRQKVSELNVFLNESINGMKIVQLFNLQGKKNKKFEQLNRAYYKANMGRVILFGVFRPLMNVIKYLTIAILLWIGGVRYIDGIISIGTLYLFTYYIGEFFDPIMNLADQISTIQSSVAASEKIYDLLDETPEYNHQKPKVLDVVQGEIRFEHVWFAYNDEEWVLKDVSFTIKPQENVAFVGHTGSGKTTIINLICGFYDVQKGRITIDGIDIRELNKSQYRRSIGLVLQDVSLTEGTILSNIKMNDHQVSDEQVVDIVDQLNLDELINTLEGGYAYPVNQGGTTLSTGQRQLISFARSLIYNPGILIMDEATSNIDSHTESLLKVALNRIVEGRTTISIAHRLSTIKGSHTIFVLHHGTVKEVGNHVELMTKQGLYYKLNLHESRSVS